MSLQQASYFCPQCQQNRLFTRQGTNHVLHLLLVLFLCGLWLPIWILIAIGDGNNPYYCSFCGYCNRASVLNDPYGQKAAALAASRENSAVPEGNMNGGTIAILILGGVVLLAIFGGIISKNSNPNQSSSFVSTNPPPPQSTPFRSSMSQLNPANSTKKSISKSLNYTKSKTAFVISENANLRDAANQSANVINVIPTGASVEVIKQSGAWFQIKYLGQYGWMHGNTIQFN